MSYPGEHRPIVATDLFEAVQAKLMEKRNFGDLLKSPSGALLKGRFFNDSGSLMSPAHTTKKRIRYRYYVSTATVQGRTPDGGSVRRVSAPKVEALVLGALKSHHAHATRDGCHLAEEIDLRVVAQKQNLDISWVDRVGPDLSDNSEAIDGDRRHVVVQFIASPQKRRREIVLPANTSGYVRPIAGDERQRLVLSIARAKAWLREVLAGATTEAIAARERKSERAIRLTLSLAFLDPKLVKAALQGSLPAGVSARRLLYASANWDEQWRVIGLSRPG